MARTMGNGSKDTTPIAIPRVRIPGFTKGDAPTPPEHFP